MMIRAMRQTKKHTELTDFDAKKIAPQTDLCELFKITDQHARRIGSGLDLGLEEGDPTKVTGDV